MRWTINLAVLEGMKFFKRAKRVSVRMLIIFVADGQYRKWS